MTVVKVADMAKTVEIEFNIYNLQDIALFASGTMQKMAMSCKLEVLDQLFF